MKFLSQLFLAATLVVMLTPKDATAQFHKSGQWIGGHLVVGTDPLGFGASYEYGLEENIGLGGQLRFWSGSFTSIGIKVTWTVIMPQAIFNYHFSPREQVDPYVGARLGFAAYSSSWESDNPLIDKYNEQKSGGLWLTLAGGARYFFSPSIAGHGGLEFRIAGEDYFDSAILVNLGVDITLK